MNEISITLNQKYKSFEQGFTTILKGNLIILSGVNGSGKSQLINIIRGREQGDPERGIGHTAISSSVLIDGEVLDPKKIEYRTFKDNINIPEVTKSNSAFSNSAVDQAYVFFKEGNLHPAKRPDFASSCIRANLILKEEFGHVNSNISERDFKTTLLKNNFIWRHEDQFTDIIGVIFYNHAMAIAQGQQDAGKIAGPAFDPISIGVAPWTELNDLFTELKLDYRFKNNYELFNGELAETPSLYSIDDKGIIIENEKRALKDLSDGEKTIISLCFTSLRRIEGEDKKLLLLDELDALLNPSLTENLFTVIKRYYLDKGIGVVITTHSPATISLAPENTSYYEVFKKNQSSVRIIEVARDEYKELQKVNKRFYDKIENQVERIKYLEAVLHSNEEILIITEGKTDWKYFLGALKHFQSKEEFTEIDEAYFYKYGSEQDVKDKVCGTYVQADLSESELNKMLANEITNRTVDVERRSKIWIGIFDSDTDIKIKNKTEYNVHSFKIQPLGISTEFLFDDSEIKSDVSGKRLYIGDEFNERSTRHNLENLNLGKDSQKRAGKREIIDCDVYNEQDENIALSKEQFSQVIYNHEIEIKEESWERFRHIFIEISRLLLLRKPAIAIEQ
jgi:ABC-type lipoprotein export system ATPase subunit